MCVCVCKCVNQKIICGNLFYLAGPRDLAGPGDQTHVIRLGGKGLWQEPLPIHSSCQPLYQLKITKLQQSFRKTYVAYPAQKYVAQ